MVERKIKLTAKEDVKEFVNEASKCDFDIDIFYNRVIIDAKSILGVLSMDLTRILTGDAMDMMKNSTATWISLQLHKIS